MLCKVCKNRTIDGPIVFCKKCSGGMHKTCSKWIDIKKYFICSLCNSEEKETTIIINSNIVR
jgi:hypothetical protein